jgi:Ser/Thr protein kinase RdoA (MazF antagonist)
MHEPAIAILAPWIERTHSLPDPAVTLLRAYTNDVYLVESRQERYVLKLYGTGWRQDSEIRFEVDLLNHLASNGVLVARPIRGRDGEVLQFLTMCGLRRQAVLFEFAAGEKPVPPFSTDTYYREGKAVGELHLAADDFTSGHARWTLDLATLIDEPLALVQALDIDDSIKQSLLGSAAWFRAEIETRARAGLDWGVCHGDLTFDNLHITGAGRFVWYDFDSGGMGWRAIDLQGWAFGNPVWSAHWHAFQEGYRESRPISESDMAAAPYLFAAQEIWGIKVDLERRVIARGSAAVHRHLVKRASQLEARRDQLARGDLSPIQGRVIRSKP